MKTSPAPARDSVLSGTLHLARSRTPASTRGRLKVIHARDLALPWQIAEKREHRARVAQ